MTSRLGLHRLLLAAAFVALAVGTLFFMGWDVARAATDINAILFLVPAAVFLGIAFWRDAAWTFAAAAVAIGWGPLIVLGLFGSASNLARPLVGAEHHGSLFLLLALVLALLGGIGGFRARRSGRPSPPLRQGLQAPSGIAAVAFAALVLGALATGLLAADAHRASAAEAPGFDFEPDAQVRVVARDYEFEPAAIALTAGLVTEVVVENLDPAFHTFTYEVDGRTYDHALPDKSTVRFLVRFDTPGTIAYWCEPHSEAARGEGDGMVGTFVVT